MSGGERELRRLLAGMQPVLDPVRYAYCRRPDALLPAGVEPLGLFREAEGVTVILPADRATAAGMVPDFVARRIVLTIHSDLQAVGFLAQVAAALAAAGIPCNVVSAAYHDHLFLPEADAERALTALRALERGVAGDGRQVLYAVSLQVDQEIAEAWLSWMRAVHVPEVLATGCFSECLLTRQLDPGAAAGRIGFLFQYRAPSLESFRRYEREHAARLRADHEARYAGRVTASRALHQVETSLLPAP